MVKGGASSRGSSPSRDEIAESWSFGSLPWRVPEKRHSCLSSRIELAESVSTKVAIATGSTDSRNVVARIDNVVGYG